MRVLTLWWIAMFCVLFAVGMLAFGRALDYQQQSRCSSDLAAKIGRAHV